MTRNRYPGKKLNENINYFETKVSFDQISNHPRIQSIQKPIEQGSLNEDKVNEMMLEYRENPNYLYHKNKIVIGDLNDTWYIIDGQHRIEMVKQIATSEIGFERGSEIGQEHLVFCWHKFTDEASMRGLFNSINKDSVKNQFYIKQDAFQQIKINEFMKCLKTYYRDSFATTKTQKGYIYTIEEVRDELIKTDFFLTELPYRELFDIFVEKNNEFYEENRYRIIFNENEPHFYVNEKKHIESKIIFSLKKNNFIQWLQDPINNEPYHKLRSYNNSISLQVKLECWVNEFANEIQGCCPLNNCSNILHKELTKQWEAGHVISYKNGGENAVNNLRPICPPCNKDMSSTNWNDYEK